VAATRSRDEARHSAACVVHIDASLCGSLGLAATGAEAIAHVKAAIRDVHAAVPDMRFTIEDSVVDGDHVWVRVRGCGTNTGPFFGPPSHQPVDITVFDQARVLDGRIVEHWGVPDRFALLAQTGVLARVG